MTTSGLPLKGRRLLLVEDQFLVAAEMKRTVESLGGEVVGPLPDHLQVASALDAQRIDLAVLDINLDGRMSYETAELLTERKVPFIFATGYERWVIDRRFADAPHLEKPVVAAALIEAVARLDAGKPG